MNSRQRRQLRRAAIRIAREFLPEWVESVRAHAAGWAQVTWPGHVQVARAPGILIEADSRGDEPAVYVLRTYRVDGEERYEVLHREPPVHDCPECAP